MRRAKPVNLLRVSLSALIAVSTLSIARQADAQDRATVTAMVKEMAAARQTRTQIQSLTKTYGPFSLRQAYDIQAVLTAEVSKSLGPVVGYKVAYASKAAREQFGMDEPASGPFLLLQRVPSGSRLPASTFLEITLETEVAFTLGSRIDRPVKNVNELKRYVKWVHAAFDAGEYRFAAAAVKPTPQDMVASGVGAHCFVLGPAVDPGSVQLETVTLELARNGQTLRESAATNVMGNPWNSLLWLANHVVKLGGSLEPGTVVLTGTASPAYKVKGDEIRGVYVGDCGPLGKVTLTID
jgi:2-keto-4-pentenoate hydratase